jgi:3-hydroxybutyryl-CoA dehydratase
MTPKEGDVFHYEKTFTKEDVLSFSILSEDEGSHHLKEDEKGRLMVQGLLTATLPARVGADLHFVGRELAFEFLEPVYSGDTLRCEARVTRVERHSRKCHVMWEAECYNQDNHRVLIARSHGVIVQSRGRR